MKHTIVIVGLGLIGGSLALALKGFEDFEVVGVDVSQPTLRYAREHAVADRVCEDAAAVLGQADVVALALHPQGIVDFLSAYRDQFKPGALVWDVCGVKSAVMQAAQVLPASVDFIGCHPMAGTEFSGIEHAFAEMFRDSHFILCRRPDSTPEHVALLERMAAHMGFRDVYQTTPEAHDALIAYTSQVMHIIAVSVCDDPLLFDCKGFEAAPSGAAPGWPRWTWDCGPSFSPSTPPPCWRCWTGCWPTFGPTGIPWPAEIRAGCRRSWPSPPPASGR